MLKFAKIFFFICVVVDVEDVARLTTRRLKAMATPGGKPSLCALTVEGRAVVVVSAVVGNNNGSIDVVIEYLTFREALARSLNGAPREQVFLMKTMVCCCVFLAHVVRWRLGNRRRPGGI